VSTKGAPHERPGQDTGKTLRIIIWYKRAFVRQTGDDLLSADGTSLENDVNEKGVLEQVTNQKKMF